MSGVYTHVKYENFIVTTIYSSTVVLNVFIYSLFCDIEKV
jgi:hypothetical protein